MPVDQHAEQLFSAWIARQQEGQAEPLDELISKHPDQAEALEQMARRYAVLEDVLAMIGMDDSAHAPSRELDEERREAVRSALDRLRAVQPGDEPFEIGEVLGRGGMAEVLRAWDDGLEREVAVKVLQGEPSPNHLWRFLVEARLTGSLDHPGIVPVHELGLDADGRPYFSMRLLDGQRLDQVIERARAEDGWSVAQVLEVLIKVCDTIAFAHARGVVHRDLKPANVMVGEFGEAYVLDWGLAWVTPREGTSSKAPLASSLETADGDVIGTPAYMPPEQAVGQHARLGPTADVYAVGAMLYELLSGRIPHADAGEILSGRETLAAVSAGPPPPLIEVAPETPLELVAICEKAMARDPGERYPDGSDLAADLRAFVMGRVVKAYTHGPWAELASWVRRNRATAALLAASVVVAIGSSITVAVVRAAGERSHQLLVSPALLDVLEARAARLVPAWPEHAEALVQLLEEVREITARRGEFRIERDRLAALGEPVVDAEVGDLQSATSKRQLEALSAQAAMLEAGHGDVLAAEDLDLDGDSTQEKLSRLRWDMIRVAARAVPESRINFVDDVIGAEYRLLDDTVQRLDLWAQGDRHTSLLADLEERLRWARTVEAASIGDHGAAWERAAAEVAAWPRYQGLVLTPQMGLVPLGADRASGLQEFAHLASGTPATRGPDGALQVQGDTGLVFVLVPPGEFQPTLDQVTEEEVAAVPLDAFLLAKHELTQAQWLHLTGWNPSVHEIGKERRNGEVVTPRHPVDNVTWSDTIDTLSRLGLALPTQAQWQYAAAADTDTERWTGDDWSTLSGKENLGDQAAARYSAQTKGTPTAEALDDGWPFSCPVDALQPNPWGFQHMLGNLSEWCADLQLKSNLWPFEPGTGARRAPITDGPRVACGSHWNEATPRRVKTQGRSSAPPDRPLGTRGFRAARALQPADPP